MCCAAHRWPAWPASVAQLTPANLLIAACVGWLCSTCARDNQRLQQLHFDFDRPADGQRPARGRCSIICSVCRCRFIAGREIGDLMVRIIYDTFSVQTIAMNGHLPVALVDRDAGGMFVVMIRIDPRLTLMALAVVPLLIVTDRRGQQPIDRLATAARIKESRALHRGPSLARRDPRRPGVHARGRILPRVRAIEQRKPRRDAAALHLPDRLCGRRSTC